MTTSRPRASVPNARISTARPRASGLDTVAPRPRLPLSPVPRPARRARSLTLHQLWTSTCYQLTLDPGAKTSSLCLTLSIHSCPHGAHGRALPVSSNPCRSRRSRHSRQTHAGLVVLVGLVGLVILVRPLPVSSGRLSPLSRARTESVPAHRPCRRRHRRRRHRRRRRRRRRDCRRRHCRRRHCRRRHCLYRRRRRRLPRRRRPIRRLMSVPEKACSLGTGASRDPSGAPRAPLPRRASGCRGPL